MEAVPPVAVRGLPAFVLLMVKALLEEAVQVVLLRPQPAVTKQAGLAEEATEATEDTHKLDILAQLTKTHLVREMLEAHPEQGVEEEVEELTHTFLAGLVAAVVAAVAEVLREIRVTREIRVQQRIRQHTTAFQLLAARPTQ